MTTVLDTTEVNALLARAESLLDGPARIRMLTYIGDRLGTKAESYAREYPERREGVSLPTYYQRTSTAQKRWLNKATGNMVAPGQTFQSKFKSLKQQRKVMALAVQGKIPRTRTGFLGNSITHEVTPADNGVLIEIGSNLSYAKYPKGNRDSEQNHYLAMLGWIPLDEDIEGHTEELRGELVHVLQSYLDGYVQGSE